MLTQDPDKLIIVTILGIILLGIIIGVKYLDDKINEDLTDKD